MPKILVMTDELYPFYFDCSEDPWGGSVEIEVTDQELAWIRNAEKRFWGAQEFLGKKYKEAKSGN